MKLKTSNNKRDRIIAGVLLGLAFFSMIVYAVWERQSVNVPVAATIDLSKLKLELAVTNEELKKGLSGRDSLDQNAGMLFLFEKPGLYIFWMKDTKIPLDIIWIDGDEVVDLVTLESPQAGFMIPRHAPYRAADKVLEINKNKAKELGIEIGSRVILP